MGELSLTMSSSVGIASYIYLQNGMCSCNKRARVITVSKVTLGRTIKQIVEEYL